MSFESHIDITRALLRAALSVSVPLYIEEIRWWTEDERINFMQKNVNLIAEKGDLLLFRSEKKGETKKVFNTVSKLIACLAFQPGGVEIFGLKFEVKENQNEKNC